MDKRMEKILKALKGFGWEDKGNATHPINYPNCRQIKRGDNTLYVAPAVENAKDVTIYDAKKLCAIIDTTAVVVPQFLK